MIEKLKYEDAFKSPYMQKYIDSHTRKINEIIEMLNELLSKLQQEQSLRIDYIKQSKKARIK